LSTLTVSTGDGQRCRCPASGRIGIGGKSADIALLGDASDNRYAFIENRDGHPWIVPATPAIEVLLNDARVRDATPLRSGDEFRLGSVRYRIICAGGELELREVESSDPKGAAVAGGATVGGPAPAPRKPHPARVRVLKGILLVLFAVLVAILLFVFFATPISVSIAPEPERVEIQGFPPPVPLRDRYLVLPGEYRVTAQKPGYHGLNESLAVARGGYTEFAYELKKLPGRVSIHSRPSGADVSAGDRYLGPTPLIRMKIEAGPHRLRLSRRRYQDAVLEIDVEGLDLEQVFSVELAPDWAPVTFRSDPTGASVIVGGEIVGTTPLSVDLLSGAHRVSFELEQYQRETVELAVEAGRAIAAPVVTLTPVPADLDLTTTPAATITVDGVYRGSTPLRLTLPPWTPHEIAAAAAGYETVKKTVELKPGEVRGLSLELVPKFGVVFVTAIPADATLVVDGRPAGRANQRLRLTARQHTLEFSRPGYQTRRIELTPRPGVSKQLSVELEPLGKKADPAAGAPSSITTGQGQELRLFSPGEFTMGSSRREQGHRANENLRRVLLSRPFYLGVKEVTNGEFRRFRPEHRSGAAYGRTLDLDNQPVVNVSWEDAVAYLNWLSAKDGLPAAYVKDGERWRLDPSAARGYRLPTEAEWAKAARFSGATARKYAWDGSYPPTAKTENFADRSASALLRYTLSQYDDSHAVSAPVGSYAANEAGVYDLGGNVAEWVHDLYAVYPKETATAVRDPTGPASGGHHVVRGAGWKDSTLSELRLSYRDYASEPRSDLGFRIARYAD
jgi:formylglycine-generating enzyme required for sulfatase activity